MPGLHLPATLPISLHRSLGPDEASAGSTRSCPLACQHRSLTSSTASLLVQLPTPLSQQLRASIREVEEMRECMCVSGATVQGLTRWRHGSRRAQYTVEHLHDSAARAHLSSA